MEVKVMQVINKQLDQLNLDEYTLNREEMVNWLREEAEKKGLFKMEKGVCVEGGIPWCSIEFTEEISSLIAQKKK